MYTILYIHQHTHTHTYTVKEWNRKGAASAVRSSFAFGATGSNKRTGAHIARFINCKCTVYWVEKQFKNKRKSINIINDT